MQRWIVRPRPNSGAEIRLFCFPYAGAGVSAFRGWADLLGESVDLCLVQLPGRENRLRDPLIFSMEELLGSLEEVLPEWLDRPYALFGHSLGGLLAFETARSMRRLGYAQPAHLFVSASRAPHLPWPHPLIAGQPLDTFLAEVQRRYGAIPAQVLEDDELRALLLPALRADLQVLEGYCYRSESSLACGISTFAGDRDQMVRPDALEAWRCQTQGTFTFELLAGDHFVLHTSRQSMLAAIASVLDPRTARAGVRKVSCP